MRPTGRDCPSIPMSAPKRRVVLAPSARLDLQDILRYTTRQWGRRQRAIYRQALYRGFDELARHPYLGKEEPKYGRNVRSFLVEYHRIIHTSRDIAGAFGVQDED